MNWSSENGGGTYVSSTTKLLKHGLLLEYEEVQHWSTPGFMGLSSCLMHKCPIIRSAWSGEWEEKAKRWSINQRIGSGKFLQSWLMPSNINITGNMLPALAHVLPYLPMCPLAWDKLQLLVTNVLQVIWKTAPSAICISYWKHIFSYIHTSTGEKSLLWPRKSLHGLHFPCLFSWTFHFPFGIQRITFWS